MTMSDDHPTGYVDLTKPNADAASSTPEPSAPEPPASTQAAPAPTEEADVLAGSPPAAPTAMFPNVGKSAAPRGHRLS